MCESSFTLDMLIQALIAGVCERLELGCQRRLQLQPPSLAHFRVLFFLFYLVFLFIYVDFLRGRRRKGGGGGRAALADFPDAGDEKRYLAAKGCCKRHDPLRTQAEMRRGRS